MKSDERGSKRDEIADLNRLHGQQEYDSEVAFQWAIEGMVKASLQTGATVTEIADAILSDPDWRNKLHDRINERHKANGDPQFYAEHCCLSPECRSVVLGSINAGETKSTGGDKTYSVKFPMDHVQHLVNYLRKMCLEKGVRIR